MTLRLLADENIDGQIVRALASHDVKWIAHDCPGILDPEVMKLALKNGRTLLTSDKLLAERYARSPEHAHLGLIFLRLAGLPEALKASRVQKYLDNRQTLSFVQLIIKKKSMRERSLPLLD